LYQGYYDHPVGNIQYYLSWIDNPTNRNALIIGLVCGVGGVIIVILVIVLYRTHYRPKESPPSRSAQYIHENLEETRYSKLEDAAVVLNDTIADQVRRLLWLSSLDLCAH